MILLTGRLSILGQDKSGYSENVNEKQFHSLHDINNFSIDVSIADIRIKVVGSDRLRVHLHRSVSGNKPYIKDNLSSGDIEVYFINFNNKITVKSSSRDIVNPLPSGANFQLNADTSSCEITCDYAITINGKQKRNTLNGTGGNLVHIKTSSGDFSLLKN